MERIHLRAYPKRVDHLLDNLTYRPITKDLPTIRKIPNELWDGIKILLPPEKPNKTIGRPVIPFRRAQRFSANSGCFL